MPDHSPLIGGLAANTDHPAMSGCNADAGQWRV